MKKTVKQNTLRIRLIVGFAVAALIFVIVVSFRLAGTPRTTPQTTPTPVVQLPAGWTFVTGKSTTDVKVERVTKSGIKPTVVFSAVTLKVTNPPEYVSKLQKGAFYAIPSLLVTDERTATENGVFTDNMEATYQNGADTVFVTQKIIITSDRVFTLTGSFGENSAALRKEIKDIFELLQNVYGN